MKKMLALTGILGMLAGSAVALAEAPEPNGVSTWIGTTFEEMLAGIVDHEGYTSGTGRDLRVVPDPYLPYGNQKAEFTVPLWAEIPCYLEMKFLGNDMNVKLQSFGPDTTASLSTTNFEIAFLSALGGFVDANWNLVPGSQSVWTELAPDGYFIRACDTYQVDLWSNLNYKYSVKVPGGYLTGPANLPIEMRSAKFVDTAIKAFAALVPADWTTDGYFHVAAGNEFTLVNGGNVLKPTRLFHQFRVPFGVDIPAGSYNGSITFTAATI